MEEERDGASSRADPDESRVPEECLVGISRVNDSTKTHD